jgi:hypothetical protein
VFDGEGRDSWVVPPDHVDDRPPWTTREPPDDGGDAGEGSDVGEDSDTGPVTAADRAFLAAILNRRAWPDHGWPRAG